MQIAVLIPCRNEEATVGQVVRGFAVALPQATIYVYDNNSTDGTQEVAREAKAVVRSEARRGKGYVVCRMLADVEADIYVLVDGDDTYDAASAPRMIERLRAEQLDMVTAVRVPTSRAAYRPGHRFGNRVLTRLVADLFENRFSDILSGYRVLSRRFVKSFPALASGFEIETALTVHALELHMPVGEMETPYKDRPEGSASKLRTYHDGLRILSTIFRLLLEVRPMYLLGSLAFLLGMVSLGLGIPVIATYLNTGLVPRLPTAVLAASLMVLASLLLASGMILDIVTLGRREAKRLRYLSLAAPPPME